MLLAPFDWLYRKLGAKYPKVFVIVELQAGFLVTAGTVVLLSAYYDGSLEDFARNTSAIPPVLIRSSSRYLPNRQGNWVVMVAETS